MKGIYRFLVAALASAGLLLFSCGDLDVENGNNPDFGRVFKTGADVEAVASGLYNTVFTGDHSTSGVHAMLAVAADHATCSWGNFGMRDMSWEPRDMAWNNAPTYTNAGLTKYSYDQWYSAILTASNVLKAIGSGVQIGTNGVDNARATAVAKFILGTTYANLALVYDRAHLVDNMKTVEPVLGTAVPYQEVAAAALAYFDEASALSNETFTIPASWLGTPANVTSATFKKMINTSAARLISYLPRNKTELAGIDWAKVKAYADAGITADWTIQMDGTDRWNFAATYYLTAVGWGRTDMYVAHMMEPSLPQHWDDTPTFPQPAQPANPLDKRLTSDFAYLASNDFLAARGYYHYSAYRYKALDAVYPTFRGMGVKALVKTAENDLLRAEARAYAGDLPGAAAIINAGTRVTRGQLAPVAENLDDILKAIHHERHVELYTTGMGIQFFEMRKLNLLQKGTPLHLPLPATFLQTIGEKTFYTFGTTARADGLSTSNGGWR
ncbi:hypothetical protein KK083_18800 [Fulvivirgaceae bacterium PWU4]|uniref:RagB/SusD family nutrient uptake outer membrane protein n=1 Tax=Chryseosolibacter histidini TaxID=2782349 RepID=A0AAP2GQH9_9BACT|nr:hypothetical protein [Chryseosolibacter histidini]MBT1698950.1 hypothetical protein [Chryseosolibacter histidini]